MPARASSEIMLTACATLSVHKPFQTIHHLKYAVFSAYAKPC
jgi:hypothetical protein